MPTFLEENPRKFALEIAEKGKCQMKTVRDLNQCLMDMSPLELLEAFMEHGVCKIIMFFFNLVNLTIFH